MDPTAGRVKRRAEVVPRIRTVFVGDPQRYGTPSEHTRQKDDWGSQAQVTQTQQRTVSEPRSHKFVRLLWITHLSGSYLELSLTFPPVVLIRDQRLIVSQLVQLPSSLVAPAARVPTVVITRIE